MPKKKLTKAQVKRKLKTIHRQVYDLMLDKLGHVSSSFSPISNKKGIELNDYFLGALNQALRKKY